jgi:hypothetical protein
MVKKLKASKIIPETDPLVQNSIIPSKESIALSAQLECLPIASKALPAYGDFT